MALDIEGSTGHLDIYRYPFNPGEPDQDTPRDYQQVVDAVVDLIHAPHNFESVVFDTADALEALIFRHVCKRDSGTQSPTNKTGKVLASIEDYGFSAGYQIALDELLVLMTKLDVLRARRNMNIIFTSHIKVKAFKNPLGDNYDRYSLSMHDKTAGLLKNWCEVVGFFQFEESVQRLDEKTKPRGVATGNRIINFERTAGYDAKTRWPIPLRLEVSDTNPWSVIHSAIVAGQNTPPEVVRRWITTECERIGNAELTKQVDEACKVNSDIGTLTRYYNTLRNRPVHQESAKTESTETTQAVLVDHIIEQTKKEEKA